MTKLCVHCIHHNIGLCTRAVIGQSLVTGRPKYETCAVERGMSEYNKFDEFKSCGPEGRHYEESVISFPRWFYLALGIIVIIFLWAALK